MPQEPAAPDLFVENRDDILLHQGMSSKELSRAVGLPVLLFHLDQLPHAFAGPDALRPFTPVEIWDRIRWLKRLLGPLPARVRHLWLRQPKIDMDNDTPAVSGRYRSAVNAAGTGLAETNILPRRLAGGLIYEYAFIFAADRTWTAKQDWAFFAGLREEQIENWPKNDKAKLYFFLHEIGHLLQRAPLASLSERVRWQRERDADAFAFSQLRRREGGEDIIKTIKMGRALSAFLKSLDRYQFALALDAEDKGQLPVTPDRCVAAGLMLRRYVFKRLASAEQKDQLEAMPSINRIEAVNDYFASIKYDAALIIPALREVLEDLPDCVGPDIHRTGELVMEAARYFCPAIACSPVPPVHPAIAASPSSRDQARPAQRYFH